MLREVRTNHQVTKMRACMGEPSGSFRFFGRGEVSIKVGVGINGMFGFAKT